MLIKYLPPRIRALVFDMDGTLYENRAYMEYQESSQIARLAGFKSIGYEESAGMLAARRGDLAARGLPPTSMARHFFQMGVPMAEIIRWRVEDIRPAEWLGPDPRLDSTLAILGRSYTLALLTNNPRSVGEAALDVLGVRRHFVIVRGLDDTGESKPSPEPFRALCEALGLPPGECVSIGDRESVDGEPALALGMGALIVSGVSEVYGLDLFFESAEKLRSSPAIE